MNTPPDRELVAIAGGDPAMAVALTGLLRHLRDHAGDHRIREMAGGVLDGTLTLRQAARSGFYGAAFADQAAELTRWVADSGEHELERHAHDAEQTLAAITTRIQRDQP